VVGFLIATLFWIGILGWQAAYAPTEMEKQKCYEAAHNGGHKSEECKSLWERTTSDPVAFFTLWLVIFTAGLTVSTVLLWRAGEKQFRHARIASMRQSRDMRASIVAVQRSADAAMLAIGSERAWFTVDQIPVIEAANGKIEDRDFARAVFAQVVWKNKGRSPSLKTTVHAAHQAVPFSDETIPVFVPNWGGVDLGGTLPIGPDSIATSNPCPLVDLERDALFERKIALVVYSAIKYFDVFAPSVERVSEICCKIKFDGSVTDQITGRTGHKWLVMAFGPQNTAT
jgi:hypothetical protein